MLTSPPQILLLLLLAPQFFHLSRLIIRVTSSSPSPGLQSVAKLTPLSASYSFITDSIPLTFTLTCFPSLHRY